MYRQAGDRGNEAATLNNIGLVHDGPGAQGEVGGVALGVTDITVRRFAERDTPVTHWTELPAGGNFLPAEQPKLFIEDVSAFFRTL